MATNKPKHTPGRQIESDYSVTVQRCKMADGSWSQINTCYEQSPCGCKVVGAGNLPAPFSVQHCPQHAAAPDLLAALKALRRIGAETPAEQARISAQADAAIASRGALTMDTKPHAKIRIDKALAAIERAQEDLRLASEMLCPVMGFVREWEQVGKLHLSIKRHWHKVNGRAQTFDYDLDESARAHLLAQEVR
jgi:hypothetical protein